MIIKDKLGHLYIKDPKNYEYLKFLKCIDKRGKVLLNTLILNER